MQSTVSQVRIKIHDAVENTDVPLTIVGSGTIQMLREEAVAYLANRVQSIADVRDSEYGLLNSNGLLELMGDLQQAHEAAAFLLALRDDDPGEE